MPGLYRRRCVVPALRSSCFIETLEPRTLLTTVSNVAELVNAVNNGPINDIITVNPGVYALTAPLKPRAGMTIQGAGAETTILTGAASWNPGTAALPEGGVTTSAINRNAYLFSFADSTVNVKILDMKLSGPQLHGALFGYNCDGLELAHLTVQDFLWSGVRTFSMDNANIHDNQFIDAGGRWQTGGVPGTTGGTTGGAIYVTWMNTSQIWNNRFDRTTTAPERNFYGIKGRQGNNSRIHHNTINVNFSIEFPHENDKYVEIDHNYMVGTVSIPKYGGGTVPAGGYTFHIHHNYFASSYALEWSRNGAEIDHNLFDFSTAKDVGNLITDFASGSDTAGNGPTLFHDNLIKNPGRGLFNSNGHLNDNFRFYNNHVIGNTTLTPRTEGMFGFPTATHFATVAITDNIFQFNGLARPLLRNSASSAATIANNTLINVSDSGNYANPDTGAVRGPTEPLLFAVGVNDGYTVDGWNLIVAPAAPSGLTATAISSSRIDLAWTDNSSNETGFKIERRTGPAGEWVLIATTAADVAAYADAGLTPGTTYFYRLSATNAAGDSGITAPVGATTTQAWGIFSATADIGAVAATGAASYAGGAYQVSGSGADIWGKADEFRFVYATVSGDATLIARVASVQNTNAWSKAGVMIRESLASTAKNAFVAVTASNGVSFQRRTASGGSSASTKVAAIKAPYWVKLVRSGSLFSAYRSADGATWTAIGKAVTISMGSTVYVGLAVTSHADGKLCAAVFDRVSTIPTIGGVAAVAAVAAKAPALSATPQRISRLWPMNFDTEIIA